MRRKRDFYQHTRGRRLLAAVALPAGARQISDKCRIRPQEDSGTGVSVLKVLKVLAWKSYGGPGGLEADPVALPFNQTRASHGLSARFVLGQQLCL